MKRLLPVLMGFALLLLSSTEGWSLPPCKGSPTSSWSTTSNWTDCVGTNTLSDGSKYVGEFKDGKWHGQGTHTFANGDKYVGEFKDGHHHGQGTYTYADGKVDKGIWEYFSLVQGTRLYPDGRVEEGIWENGAFKPTSTVTAEKSLTKGGSLPPCSGSPASSLTTIKNWTDCVGTVTFANYGKYVGEWKDGEYQGQGTFTSADGRRYEGIWENSMFSYAKRLSPSVTAKKTPLEKAKQQCAEIGFKKGTEKFGDCVMKLLN